MALNVLELEQRLSNLQSQIISLSQRTERNGVLERRMSAMADEYAEHLKRWANTVDRHARAVAQLETYIADWKDAAAHVQEDSSQRLKDLEVIVERELHALQKIQEEPLKELRQQAASLTAMCAATADAAQHGFDRAESRLALFEGDVSRALTELTREVRAAVMELRAHAERPTAQLDGSRQWAFDDVNRLHSQLRHSSHGGHSPRASLPQGEAAPTFDAGGTAADIATFQRHRDDVSMPEGAPLTAADADGGDAAGREPLMPRAWRLAVVGLGVALIVVGGLGWRLYDQVRAGAERVHQAEIDSARATALAESQAARVREEATREIAGARDMAAQAQRISGVLAAPDLVRYNLAGSAVSPRSSGQALWSRSRGLVFSASGLPPAPVNQHHQLWLLTRVAPVRADTLPVAADGTVTAVQQPPVVQHPVVGVMVTLEQASDANTPSGPVVLTSVPSAQ